MSQTLGLFPLNAVLMPGATLRLHIFEDRYKAMIAECIEREVPFGVLLDRNGREVGDELDPVDVGTTAHITDVRRLASGRFYIVTRGMRRFRVERVVRTEPYWLADVSYLEELAGPAEDAEQLRQTATAHFAEYLRILLALFGRQLDDLKLPDDLAASSYLIADTLQVAMPVKQSLLEASSAAQRLRRELELLSAETERLRAFRARQKTRGGRSQRWPFDVRFSRN